MQKTHFTKFFFLSILAFTVSIAVIIYIVKTNIKDIPKIEQENIAIKETDQVAEKQGTIAPQNPSGNIEISSPQKDTQVSYILPIMAEVSGNIEVSKVEFYVDKKLIASDTKEPYNGIWDTTKESNGIHIINVKSYDKKGVVIATKSIFSTVFNNNEAPTTKKGLPVGPQFVN